MIAPPNLEGGQSTTRPRRFNDQYYEWWKTRMFDFIMAEDSELMNVIFDGPHVPVKEVKEGKITKLIAKTRTVSQLLRSK
ncbi:hypothetical protein P3S68_008358 [Capsicum galapagoense]